MTTYLKDKSDVPSINKELEKISPFELKNRLIDMADESVRKMMRIMLNAGRGNPNWVATVPREAFFALGEFGLEECRHDGNTPQGIAGIPRKQDIAQRFGEFLKARSGAPGVEFLKEAYEYMLSEMAVNPDELVHEWAEGVIGDQYPVPDRILPYTERIVKEYLKMELCDNQPPQGEWDLFATEGGTAAMCYIFDSLQQNFLLQKGDDVALLTPAFTPYIEIPALARYSYRVTNIPAARMTDDGLHLWQYRDEDIDKLRDPKFKALFLINPSNPPSYALADETIDRIVEIVEKWNPNLMIVTDDVYATYVPHFHSLFSRLPHNTLCVYSFSKYFGATGWRLAVVALARDNVYDRLIARLARKRKSELEERYGTLTTHVEEMRFIDRMVADSRQVALNHTAGLSLPGQLQMSLFALYSIIDTKRGNGFRTEMLHIIDARLKALWDSMGFKLLPDPLRAGYYSEIDLLVWARKCYGEEFVSYLKSSYSPLDVVFRLARETSLVVLNGGGFDGPEWSIRVSLANLNEKDYVTIGENIRRILGEYATLWRTSKKSVMQPA